MELKDCGIWITGASSGIGKETAKEFARIGCKVFASSRRHSIIELINRELNDENLSVEVYPCNVGSTTNVNQIVNKISENHSIDCLVNNAGISSFKKAEENSLKEIKDIINTNLIGSINCIKAVLPQMIERKRGTIINIISVTVDKVLTNSSAYSASKAGLHAYAKVLREEVRKYNIKVINIIPGATKTAIWPDKVLEKYSDRMMNPEDIARLIVSSYLQDKFVTEEIILRPIGGDL